MTAPLPLPLTDTDRDELAELGAAATRRELIRALGPERDPSTDGVHGAIFESDYSTITAMEHGGLLIIGKDLLLRWPAHLRPAYAALLGTVPNLSHSIGEAGLSEIGRLLEALAPDPSLAQLVSADGLLPFGMTTPEWAAWVDPQVVLITAAS